MICGILCNHMICMQMQCVLQNNSFKSFRLNIFFFLQLEESQNERNQQFVEVNGKLENVNLYTLYSFKTVKSETYVEFCLFLDLRNMRCREKQILNYLS